MLSREHTYFRPGSTINDAGKAAACAKSYETGPKHLKKGPRKQIALGLGPNATEMMPLAGCATTGGDGGAAATETPPFCTIVAADMSDFSYLSCPLCELALPDGAASCFVCAGSGGVQPAPARVYRLLLSLATHDRVFPVVLFDRAARTLMGCPADELARLFATHPGSACAAAEALRGEMCRVVMRAPTRNKRSAGAAEERQRVVSVVPLRDGFRPVVDALRMLYPRG